MTISLAPSRTLRTGLLFAAILVAGTVALYFWQSRRALDAELMRSAPAAVLKNTTLVDYAQRQAAPLYRDHCASCHGAQQDAAGRKPGVPSLADSDWLYGNSLVDLEQIVMYGIRSGHPRARNVTDMPALGRTGQLTDDEVEDAVQYVLQLSQKPADATRATRGRVIYTGKGNCFDCHANDARGVTDYGTPPLNGTGLIYGGDHDTLYRSVYDGRHGLCPNRARTLTPLQARVLAVSLHEGVSKRE
jgi:cytochrome c oxidase cbb3-type subunit 3